ncbi:MAG: T9SS type A sorting domain-containing protein [Bacteroidetes bacterium]|nr:T9SS type A sorting domain-containing protein [Bacteroidota bacterium]
MKNIQITCCIIFLFILNNVNAQCSWQEVGPSEWTQPEVTIGFGGFNALGIDENNHPYFMVLANDKSIQLRKNINGSWFTADKIDHTNPFFWPENIKGVAASDHTPYLCYSYGFKLMAYKFVSNAWDKIGLPGTEPDNVGEMAPAVFGSDLYAAYCDRTSYKISVKKFDGYNWQYVGSPEFSLPAQKPVFAFSSSGTPWIAYRYTMDSVIVSMYNGTDWNSTWNLGKGSDPKLVIGNDGFPVITYISSVPDPVHQVYVKKFDGVNWNLVGGTICATTSFIMSTDLVLDSLQRLTLFVADYTSTPGLVYNKVFQYNGIAWNQLGIDILGTNGIDGYIAIDTSNAPVIVYEGKAFSSNTVNVRRFDGLTWTAYDEKGIHTSESQAFVTGDTNSVLYTAYYDDPNGQKITVKKRVANSWATVGVEGFTPGVAEFPTIAIDSMNIPYVSFSDYTISPAKISVMKFNGTSWQYVGTPGMGSGSASGISELEIDAMQQPLVCMMDLSAGVKAFVYNFDGTNWSVLGGTSVSTTSSGVPDPKMEVSDAGNVYVAMKSSPLGSSNLFVRKFNGTSWQNHGGLLALNVDPGYSIASFHDTVYVAYCDINLGHQLVVKKFNGTTWDVVGSNLSSFCVSGAAYPNLKIDSNGKLIVLFGDYIQKAANVVSFDGSTWVRMGAQNYTRNVYNNDERCLTVMKDNSSYSSDCWGAFNYFHKFGDLVPSYSELVSVNSCSLDTVQFKTSVITPGVYFQWQENNGTMWSDVLDDAIHLGAQSSTLTIVTDPSLNTFYYRCIFSDACGTDLDTTNSALLQVDGLGVAAVITSLGPTAFCAGGNDALSFIADSLQTYHWIYQGVPVSAAIDTFYVASATGNYEVISQNSSGCSITSAPQSIYVVPDYTIPLSSTDSIAICAGSLVELTADSISGLSYQWQMNGINIPGMTDTLLSVSTAGVYNLISTDSVGCTDTSTYTTSYVFAIPNAIFTNSVAPFLCAGDSIILTTLNDTTEMYLWLQNGISTGITDTSLTIFASSLISLVATNTFGCVDTSSSISIVQQLDCDTWPGDANNDGLVDNTDLLPIGIYYGQTGLSRPGGISNVWQAWPSTDWVTAQPSGQDIKHVDCNGDGIIDSNDTLAVNLNFSSVHAFAPNVNDARSTNPDLYFQTSGSSYLPGDWVNVDVMAGTSALPVINLYGLAFNINYDASLVQSGTESLTYSPSWFATSGTDAIKIFKVDAPSNTAFGAETRINHMNANGYGKIATFKFQTSTAITSSSTMNFSFSYYQANDSVGNNLFFYPLPITIPITISGIAELSNLNFISIFPNPYSGQASISYSLKEKSDVSIEVYTALGQMVKTIINDSQNAGDYKFLFSAKENGYEAGVYFVKFTIDGKTIMRKIVEMK